MTCDYYKSECGCGLWVGQCYTKAVRCENDATHNVYLGYHRYLGGVCKKHRRPMWKLGLSCISLTTYSYD